ncbi:MAG TPA: DUF2520 domain-containing protein [Leeuwenhoekiella sp.]|nr:DUF2520 domain-containing protein [Leeuwenhoekiella sp.]HBO28544.1 DUF2520 domain-containing protein [Leeuwenhoekiella sp.]|tara:strand:- start:944 stop:1717 length:774 start_codon:yes stop_codon:yes gene_type:complete
MYFWSVISVSIIGTGNVAFHLAKALSTSQSAKLQFIAGRSTTQLTDFKAFAEVSTQVSDTFHSDLIILAVSDNAIGEIAEKLQYTNGLLVHTSGSTAMDVLAPKTRIGVCYPLQTFSKRKDLNYSKIPFLLEANHQEDYALLEKLLGSLNAPVHQMNSKDRASIHLAAVFSNNFTNHILTEAAQLCNQHQVSFELLKPLLEETLEKAFLNGPENSQTGPAKRHDTQTIQKQLEALKTSEQQELYSTLTKAIQNYYER